MKEYNVEIYGVTNGKFVRALRTIKARNSQKAILQASAIDKNALDWHTQTETPTVPPKHIVSYMVKEPDPKS
jgi:hypothetical protein